MPVEHGAAHFRGLLTKAVYPAFALFVARGVPGQVVVDNRGEQVLQVDAFRQAIGCHQDAAVGFAHVLHALTPLFGREFACDGLDVGMRKLFLEVVRYVVGGGDVAAEHHWMIAILEQLADMLNQCGQLGVAGLAGKALGRRNEVLQAGRVLHLSWRLQVAGR